MKNNLLVITSFPQKGQVHGAKTVGVASYTKALLYAVKKSDKKMDIEVWAEKLGRTKGYKEKGIEIKRVWERGSVASIAGLFKEALKNDNQKVLLSFEAFLFGGYVHAMAGILGMLFLKLNGKKTYILLHQVATDFSKLEDNFLKAKILNLFSKLFYKLVKLSATKVIVFEEDLKSKLGGEDNVKVLPHLVTENKSVTKKVARKKLELKQNKTYVLYFGYLAPYKGADWLVENWPESDAEIIIGGGINPNHKNKKDIQEYVQNVNNNAIKREIIVSGYIDEKDIKQYYSAVDAVILPYKIFMSSSGPLALAFSYETPVLLSEQLKEYAKTSDFKNALKEAGLKTTDIVFKFNSKDLDKKIKYIKANKNKFIKFAELMKNKRSSSNIANQLTDYLDMSLT